MNMPNEDASKRLGEHEALLIQLQMLKLVNSQIVKYSLMGGNSSNGIRYGSSLLHEQRMLIIMMGKIHK
jgi:hypothetical protein